MAEDSVDRGLEDINILKKSGSVKDAVFGVLYTLSKEKDAHSWKWSVFEVLVHFIQLLVILIASHFSWDFGAAKWLADTIMATDVTNIMEDVGYTAFSAIFWSQFALLALSLLICGWVAWSFKTGTFPFVWPIKFVRFFVALFMDTFYITALAVFLMSFRCTPDADSTFDFYPDKKCSELPHLPAVVAAVPTAVATIALGWLTSVAESSLDPFTPEVLSVSFSHATSRVFVAHTVLDILDVFLAGTSHRSTLAVLLFPFFVYALITVIWHAPYLNELVNCVEAGLAGILAWISGLLVVLELAVGSDGQTSSMARPITDVCLAGIVPAFALASVAMYMRLRPSKKRAREIADELKRFVIAKLDKDLSETRGGSADPRGPVDMVKAVHNLLVRSEEAQMASGVPPLRFSSPIEVEHIARCMRNTDAYGNLVEEWLVTALVVLHEGIAQFPDCTRLHMAYGNFIASVMENHQLAAEQFTSVRRSPINVDLQFQCFCRNREQAQSAGSSSSADGAMDLVSFVEFQNNLKAVQRMQNNALAAIRQFWAEILGRETTTLSQLALTLRTLSGLEAKAHRLYRVMLERYPNNVSVIRLYATFLTGVKCAPGRALRMFNKADALEDAQSDVKQGAFVGETLEGNRGVTMAGPQDGVIVINDTGTVQFANRNLNRLFGYTMGELVGSNVTILMPRPFSQRHDGYLASYKSSRMPKVIGRERMLIGLHKDGSAFPLRLMVSNIVKDGTEQFMAIVKKAEVDPARGLVYMTTEGAILCVSEGFTNLFGWSSKDVSGQTLLNVAEEALEINQALTIIKDTLVLEQTKSSPEAPRQRRRSVPLASRLSSAAEGTSQKERKDSARLSGQGARGQKVMGAYAKRPSIEGRAGMVQGVLANMKHRYLKKTLQAHADFGIVGTTENAVLEVSFRLVDDIFGVFAAGRDGRLVFVNTAVEVALGYPRGSLLEGGATIGHLMPPGMGRFHQGRLHRTLTSGEPSPVHVPCKMGQTVAMRGNQSTRVPARLSWQILKPTDNAPPLYVCQLQKVPFDPSLGAWGFRSGDGLIERQICLRMLCCQRGQILGVGHGWGFVKTTVPGGIFGIDARTLLGQNLSDVIDALSGTVKIAKKFNPDISAERVMEGVLDQLASPGVSSAVASFRAAILCPCRPGDSVEKVPIRMTAKPVSDSRVNLVALQKLGAVAQEDLDALQSGLVIDVWSTNWITAEVLVSRNGVVLEASHMFEILTGVPVSRVVGMKASHVLGSSCEGVISGRKTQSETRMRHADQSVFSVSLLGPGDVTLGQKRKKVLVVRGVHEAPEADTEVLHRMQVILDRESGRRTSWVNQADPSTVEENSHGDGSSSTELIRADKVLSDAPRRVQFGSQNDTGGIQRVHSRMSKINEDADEEQEAEESGEEEDSDSEFADEDIVRGFEEIEADDTSSQGVGRSHFRRSKQFKNMYELLKKSRLMQQMGLLLPSILGILSVGLLLHIVLFIIMIVFVQNTTQQITRAATDGEIYYATVQLPPLARRLQNAAQGGYWAQVDYITLDGLREDLSVIVEDLYTHMLEEYTGGNKTGDLAALLEGGLEIDWFLDVDKGDGLGPRDVYVGPKLQDGLLRLSGLLATSANRVADLSDVELANAARDSRHWRWVVEGVEDPFLPTQSTLLADAYDRGRAVLESLVKDILVLGMIQAAVLMPICAIVSLMRMRTLLSEKGQLFAVFLTVPRPVLYHMAAGTGQLVTGREGEDAAMLDFGSELSEEEKRLVRKLERSTGKGLDKVLRFVRGDKELKDDTWRLQAVVAVPLVLMTAICLATHITANQFLQAVRDPVAAYEDTFRVEANIVQVRHWTNEIASLVSVGETVNPWGLTYEEVANNLSEASNALGESWTRLLFGGEGSDHNGIAYVSSTIEKEIFAPGCLRKDKDTCLQPGDPNYAKSVEGLNQTMRTYVVEALMFAGQDPSTFSKEQFEYLWYIGSIDLEDGVHRVGEVLKDEASSSMQLALLLEGCLLGLIVVAQFWLFWFLRPQVRAGMDEIKWAAQMLSRLPDRMGTVQKLREVLNLDDTEDSFHLEESKSLAERFFAKVHAWARKTVLGVEYESYMQWRHWRESQGIPLPQKGPGLLARAYGAVKRVILRPILGETYKAWTEIDKIRQSKHNRVGPEDMAPAAPVGAGGKVAPLDAPDKARSAEPSTTKKALVGNGPMATTATKRLSQGESGAVVRRSKGEKNRVSFVGT